MAGPAPECRGRAEFTYARIRAATYRRGPGRNEGRAAPTGRARPSVNTRGVNGVKQAALPPGRTPLLATRRAEHASAVGARAAASMGRRRGKPARAGWDEPQTPPLARRVSPQRRRGPACSEACGAARAPERSCSTMPLQRTRRPRYHVRGLDALHFLLGGAIACAWLPGFSHAGSLCIDGGDNFCSDTTSYAYSYAGGGPDDCFCDPLCETDGACTHTHVHTEHAHPTAAAALET